MKNALEHGIELNNNVWLGIRYDSISFLKPSNKE